LCNTVKRNEDVKMILEETIITHTVFFRIDVRIKIISVVLLSILIALFSNPQALLGALVLGLIVILLARIPFKQIVKRLLPVNGFILLLWLFLPITMVGPSLFTFGFFTISSTGVQLALQITIKANALMLLLLAFTSATPVVTLGHALQVMGVPQKLVFLFFITYRYIHVIYCEYIRLLTTIKMRGFTPKTNWHTYQTYAYLVGMLLLRSYDRAQRVYQAMQCRGFSGQLFSLHEFTLQKRDFYFLGLVISMLIVLGVIEWV
jgi:cobalt/nickel transport system permease protein